MKSSQKHKRKITLAVSICSIVFILAVGISIYISGAFRVFMGPADYAAQVSDKTEQTVALHQKLTDANSESVSEDYTPIFIATGCLLAATGILVFVIPHQAKKKKQ